MYTKTHERVKIIVFGFFVGEVHTGYQKYQNFDTNARRLTNYDPNEILVDFSIPQHLIGRINSVFFIIYFKGMD